MCRICFSFKPIFFLLLILNSFNVYSQWQVIENLTGGSQVSDIIKFKDKIFITSRNKGIYYSSDGGYSWKECNIDGIYYPKSMVVHKEMLYVIDNSNLYISADGESWTTKLIPDNFSNQIISDGEVLYLLKQYKGAFISKNEGITWESIFDVGEKYIDILSIANEGNLILLGTTNGRIFRTTNEGKNWDTLYVDTSNSIYQMYLISGKAYINIGNKILKADTTDYNWQDIAITKSSSFNIKYFYAKNAHFVYSNYGKVYVSDDYGVNWRALNEDIT